MTKYEQIISIKTLDDAIEFINQFIESNGIEDVYICDKCPKVNLNGCYNKKNCQPKIIKKYLTQEII